MSVKQAAQQHGDPEGAHHALFRTVIEELTEWNFAWVAEASGVTEPTLYNWYNGRVQNPQLRTIVAVANAIGLEVRAVRRPQAEGGRRRHLRVVG